MEHSHFAPRFLRGSGVEIGAFKTPIPGAKPVYVDRFSEYAGEPTRAEYHGDACELPFLDNSLPYVATSHVFEHVANPLAALVEWFRVMRHDGYIYMVVPDRRRTFDHPRQLTAVTHMLDDFRDRVTQSDATHIEDFAFGVDWAMFSPATPASEAASAREALALSYRRSVAAGLEINIHFHTFESGTVVELIQTGNRERLWDGEIALVDIVELFPSSNPIGFLVIAQVKKRLAQRWNALFSRQGLRRDARKL
jgi:SAM-dependent methyltransferase